MTFGVPAREVLVAAALALLALAVALWLERGRHAGAHRAARATLLALACALLFLLATHPLRESTMPAGEATLLTTGATAADAADAAAATVWSLPGESTEPAAPLPASRIPDAAWIARAHPEVRRLRVLGFGLTAAELAALPASVEAAAPPPLPTGIARVAWPRRLALGEPLVVRGSVAGVPARGAVVRLGGPSIDDVAAPLARGEAAFALPSLPRGPGRQLLTLRVEAPGAAPRVETLDVEVVRAAPPAVLWLEGAPTPEGREVKRWLAGSGGALAWRARVSRAITRDEVVGLPALPKGPLTPATLARFDLIVADAATLGSLGAGERAALLAAVRDGAGLLLRAGDSGAPSPLGVPFAVRATPGGGEEMLRLDWGESASAPIALPARELTAAGAQVPFLADRQGRVLGAWQPLGAGSVGVTLVEGSWRWVLDGHAADQRQLWTRSFAALARQRVPSPRWSPVDGPLRVDAPLELYFTGAQAAPAARVRTPSGERVSLAPRQDVDDPARWTTTFWPRESGWHQVGGGGSAASFWVAPADAWTTWRLAGRIEATAARAAAPPASSATSTVRRPVPLARWPLVVLLILALAALWADEQFGGPAAPRPADAEPATAT